MHPESEAARAVISELHLPRVRTFLDSVVWKEYSIKTKKKHMSLGSRCSTAVSNPKVIVTTTTCSCSAAARLVCAKKANQIETFAPFRFYFCQ